MADEALKLLTMFASPVTGDVAGVAALRLSFANGEFLGNGKAFCAGGDAAAMVHFMTFGEYLGLTSARIDGGEMAACGLATHFVPSVNLPSLERELCRVNSANAAVIGAIIDVFAQKVPTREESGYRSEVFQEEVQDTASVGVSDEMDALQLMRNDMIPTEVDVSTSRRDDVSSVGIIIDSESDEDVEVMDYSSDENEFMSNDDDSDLE
ncbi:hypothetical protein Scep_026841 [Stephania cephalantha]|uniref:3-hydroxyisobutyryl-CoA hydrolase n=2 Tax=Stephania cephalantha TaxID=152367 RepID=A0AAP0ER77_9MAGN